MISVTRQYYVDFLRYRSLLNVSGLLKSLPYFPCPAICWYRKEYVVAVHQASSALGLDNCSLYHVLYTYT